MKIYLSNKVENKSGFFSYIPSRQNIKKCPNYYTVAHKTLNDLIFAKIVDDNLIIDADPYFGSGVLTVNGYNQDELERVNKDFLNKSKDDYKRYQCTITNFMYRGHSTNMFKHLSEYMHFCSVIWDDNTDSLIAGVTKPNSEYTHLYYGYTKQNHELMFSNNKTILEQL